MTNTESLSEPVQGTRGAGDTVPGQPPLPSLPESPQGPAEPDLPGWPRFARGIRALRRGPGGVQIGLDPAHAVVAEGLHASVAEAIRTLDGRESLATLCRRAGEHAAHLRSTLHELHKFGLLEDARPERPRRLPSVVIYGAGPLSGAVAALLAASGVRRIDGRTGGSVGSQESGYGFLPSDVGLRRKAAIREVVQRVNPSATDGVPAGHAPDLAILTDSLVPAPELVRFLMHERQPHLLGGFRDGTGIVGPLVIPGRSSCLTCADLYRTDADPEWPSIAGQLAGQVQSAAPATIAATAALAVTHALTALEVPTSTPPALCDTTAQVDPGDLNITVRRWQAHPRCECGAFRH